MGEMSDFQRSEVPNWCPGCGDYAIMGAVKKALAELDIKPHQAVLASGVGCFAKLPYWVKVYGFVGLHGRTLPVAQGIKLANPKLKVIAFGGDGDGYGEGGNHFIHACRRNINIPYFVHNNEVFGLTTGQYSPTAEKGTKSKSSPKGSVESPVNPLALALSSGATFVARAYAGHLKEMVQIMKQAILHEGFAFVDIVQACPSFGKTIPVDKMVYLTSPFLSRGKALEKVVDDDKITLGVFYQEKKEE
ncbi:2-oxoacid:ferredoxin oxidoreductase subunit beta [Candidatus Woesearchaeota archaeon]|nr:2-oxoacid:ferredoxin oxidoreductase subunit beta [Candidatus Woesearchaeota archaeon]